MVDDWVTVSELWRAGTRGALAISMQRDWGEYHDLPHSSSDCQTTRDDCRETCPPCAQGCADVLNSGARVGLERVRPSAAASNQSTQA
jgi:hypothetical protein